jgi:hypothetical protein
MIIFFVSIPLIWIFLFLLNELVLIRHKVLLNEVGHEKVEAMNLIFSPILTVAYLCIIFHHTFLKTPLKFLNDYRINLRVKMKKEEEC